MKNVLLGLLLLLCALPKAGHSQTIALGIKKDSAIRLLRQFQSEQALIYDEFAHGLKNWGVLGSAAVNFQRDTVASFFWISDSLSERIAERLADSIRNILTIRYGEPTYTDILAEQKWTWHHGRIDIALAVVDGFLNYSETGPQEPQTVLNRLNRYYDLQRQAYDSLQKLRKR